MTTNSFTLEKEQVRSSEMRWATNVSETGSGRLALLSADSCT